MKSAQVQNKPKEALGIWSKFFYQFKNSPTNRKQKPLLDLKEINQMLKMLS